MVNDDDAKTLTVMMTEVATKLQVLLDKQDELAENIGKIKEAVYNPDKGLYARLTKLDSRLDMLESWKHNNTKVLWVVATACSGVVVHALWQAIF